MLAILLPFAIQQALDPVRRHLHVLRRWSPVLLMGGALPLTVSRSAPWEVERWRPEQPPRKGHFGVEKRLERHAGSAGTRRSFASCVAQNESKSAGAGTDGSRRVGATAAPSVATGFSANALKENSAWIGW